MNDARMKLRPAEALSVPVRDADALLEAGNGDAALLYLHILRAGGVLDPDRAATALHRSDRDVETAANRLCRMGLLTREDAPDASGAVRAAGPSGGNGSPRSSGPAGPSNAAGRAAPPSRELPEYQAKDVVRRSMESRAFMELVEAVQVTLGRLLSSADVKKLFGVYDELALPPEVILLLVEHCREEVAAKYGPEKNVGFAFIEKQAYEWFNREILTYEQAEQWLREHKSRREAVGRLRAEMGLTGRRLAPTEERYLNNWLDLGFGPEALLIAYDRTVTKTNRLTWNYMDTIVRSWHEAGLHTPAEIESGDAAPVRGGKRTVPAAAPNVTAASVTAPTREDDRTMDQLDRLMERMKNGQG